jgi:hypothetical protein
MEVDARELGPRVLDFYATSLERGLAVRERSDPARFVDVTHDDFVDDALGVARRIYAHFGLSLSKAAEAALRAHIVENPKGKRGRHAYALEEWGLSADAVRERFAPYIERFGLEGVQL